MSNKVEIVEIVGDTMHFDLKSFTGLVSRLGVETIMLGGVLWPIYPACSFVRWVWQRFELWFWWTKLKQLKQLRQK